MPKRYSDSEIINGCKKNKQSMQEALYSRYGGVMMGICRRYAGNEMEAEDIFQEGFVKVFHKIDQYKGGSIEGWMKKVFINTAINYYHKYKKFRNDHSYEDISEEPISEEMDALQSLSNEELINIIEQLPEGYRIVFNMWVIEGYEHKEIAEHLGITVGTSKSQLYKAKAMLKSMVEKNFVTTNG